MSRGSDAARLVRAIKADLAVSLAPPSEGVHSERQLVIPMSIVKGTRGYIEAVANQVNGTYENGWYDACAVMVRRLLETLIIEAFEKHGLDDKIKNANGDFLYLRDLIDKTLAETAWGNLGREAKNVMPKLKNIGDRSAHSRRYTAHLKDLNKHVDDIRIVVQELLYLSGLR